MSKAPVEKIGFEKNRTVHFEMRNKHVEAFGYKFKSQQEYKWAQYLNLLKKSGQIADWQYEPRKFEMKERYRKRRVYTPDFLVADVPSYNARTEWHEVKTSLRQKDVSRFKWFRVDYPDERIILIVTNNPRKTKNKILLDNARKYVDDVIFAGPIFNKLGITGQDLKLAAFEQAQNIQKGETK